MTTSRAKIELSERKLPIKQYKDFFNNFGDNAVVFLGSDNGVPCIEIKEKIKDKDSDELVMYILVNSSLKMTKGKIAAQVAHAVLNTVYTYHVVNNLNDRVSKIIYQWLTKSHTKIVLKIDNNGIQYMASKYSDINTAVYDEGRTQIESGSLTSLAFVPMKKSDCLEELKTLKLL